MKKFLILVFSICIATATASIFTDYQVNFPYFKTVDSAEIIKTNKINSAADIIREVNNKIDTAYAYELAEMIYNESSLHNVSYSLLLAIIQTESRFNNDAKSWAGAKGIMQIMPMTFKSISEQHGYNYSAEEIYDVKKNLRIGTLYLFRLQKRFTSIELIAAGYNGGPGVAMRYKKYRAGEDVYIPDETKKYVSKVSLLSNKYKKILEE